MGYKAKNIDTDKVLKAIEDDRVYYLKQQAIEIRGIEKYYEGLQKGLDIAQRYFECANYEKDEKVVTKRKQNENIFSTDKASGVMQCSRHIIWANGC